MLWVLAPHCRTWVETTLPTILAALGSNSHRAHRCLQESWRQITSMYFNTHKKYKWLHFSEDCLYLNVYVPVGALGDPLLPVSTQPSATHHPTQAPHCPAQASALLAQVMVWFPGHAFLVGSASTYDGSKLAAREKVVLVLLHHSLGVPGFLRWAGPGTRGGDQGRGLLWTWAQGGGRRGLGGRKGARPMGRIRVRGVTGAWSNACWSRQVLATASMGRRPIIRKEMRW